MQCFRLFWCHRHYSIEGGTMPSLGFCRIKGGTVPPSISYKGGTVSPSILKSTCVSTLEGVSESQIARFNVRKPGPHAKGFPLGLIAFGFVCACLLEQIQHAQVSAFVFSTCKVRDHVLPHTAIQISKTLTCCWSI